MDNTIFFYGSFLISPCPSEDIVKPLDGQWHIPLSSPLHGTVNHWLINNKGVLEWDGCETFPLYYDWLTFLIDHVFSPEDHTLTGRILYLDGLTMGYLFASENGIRKTDIEVTSRQNGDVLSIEMPDELNEDLEKISRECLGVDFATGFRSFMSWAAEHPAEVKKWLCQKEKV